MLMLCSDGLSSQPLLDAAARRLQEGRTAALVVTADDRYKANNYHVPRCRAALASLGLTVTTFDLDVDPAQALRDFDVVECIGGNPFYLLHAIRAHRCRDVFEEIARDRLLVGWSAAAFVFGPTLALVNRYSPELNTVGLKDLTALRLTDTQVLPHYSRFLHRFPRFEETCADYEQTAHCRVLRLNDGEGVLVDGEEPGLIHELISITTL